MPVPVVNSIVGGTFNDPALSINLCWNTACSVTVHDDSPHPVQGYRLEVFVDANGNGIPEPPTICDGESELYETLLDIAPIPKTDDGIPDRSGDRLTESVTLGLSDLQRALTTDLATIEAMTFRLRILFQDDRTSALGIGGFDRIIDPVISAPSIRSLPLSFAPTVCFDLDGDGFGDLACPNGGRTDCNDSDPAVHPDATEVLDGIDNDCDGFIDEAMDDDDGDGVPNQIDLEFTLDVGLVGVNPNGIAICSVDPDGDGDGFPSSVDCNDGDATVNPGAAEICNNTDDDCDGFLDEGFDVDGDSFTSCDLPTPDCDDFNSSINPLAAELPGNVVDENCDGSLGICDPNAPWEEHGEFVLCVSNRCETLVEDGVLTEKECEALISQAAKSDVGK